MTDSRDFKKEYPASSYFSKYLVCRGDYADVVRACFGF